MSLKEIRNLLWTLIIFTLTTACGSVSNPDVAVGQLEVENGFKASQVDSIESVLSKYPNGTQLSIAVMKDSSVQYYGSKRQNDTLLTIENSDKVFEIGSLTKVFTSTLLADLSIKGEVELDHPIQKYLDFSLKDSLAITFKQLANHTSGLPRIPSGFVWESFWHMDNPYKDYDEEKLQNYLTSEIELKTEPGTNFQYSNIGAGLLGYVLTQVADISYEELLQEHIFRPLNMQSSTTERKLIENRLITGLSKRGNPTSNWDLASLKGAGAILSTTRDLVKFGLANFDSSNTVLNLQRQKTFSVDENMDIALGWLILNQEKGDPWYFHNGGTGGYRSAMVLDVEDRDGIVVLSNISSGHKYSTDIDNLAKNLLKSVQ